MRHVVARMRIVNPTIKTTYKPIRFYTERPNSLRWLVCGRGVFQHSHARSLSQGARSQYPQILRPPTYYAHTVWHTATEFYTQIELDERIILVSTMSPALAKNCDTNADAHDLFAVANLVVMHCDSTDYQERASAMCTGLCMFAERRPYNECFYLCHWSVICSSSSLVRSVISSLPHWCIARPDPTAVLPLSVHLEGAFVRLALETAALSDFCSYK